MPAPSSFTAALAENKPAAIKRLRQALERNGGSKSAAAADLKLGSYKTLWKIGQRHAHVQAILDEYGLSSADAAAVATAARRKSAKKRRSEKKS